MVDEFRLRDAHLKSLQWIFKDQSVTTVVVITLLFFFKIQIC